jgi:hypothetical protein
MVNILKSIQLQADVPAFVVGFASLCVSTYIALLLHRLSRRISKMEAIRAVNQQWDSFNNAMLNPDNHKMFWEFIRSEKPFTQLGEPEHHIVQMYLNTVHTEYHSIRNGLVPGDGVAYLDKLIERFVPKRCDLIALSMLLATTTILLNFSKSGLRRSMRGGQHKSYWRCFQR